MATQQTETHENYCHNCGHFGQVTYMNAFCTWCMNFYYTNGRFSTASDR